MKALCHPNVCIFMIYGWCSAFLAEKRSCSHDGGHIRKKEVHTIEIAQHPWRKNLVFFASYAHSREEEATFNNCENQDIFSNSFIDSEMAMNEYKGFRE